MMNIRRWLVSIAVLAVASLGAAWWDAANPWAPPHSKGLAPVAAAAAAEPGGGRRVALVIGNGAYNPQTGWNRLRSPGDDAAAVAGVLRDRLKFDAVMQATDRSHDQMIEDLDRFAQALGAGDTAFFYFSGHGVGIGSDNYLIPVDAGEPTSELRLKSKGVSVREVLGLLDERRTALNVIVLDACRNNPLVKGKAWGGSGLKGIGRQDLRGETLIAYATAPDATAADGSGALSPYTTALVAELAVPGKDLWALFGAVTGRVQRATDAQQQPWKNDTLTQPHTLMPPTVGPVVQAPPPPPPVAVGYLQVSVDAPGSRVWVDGREVGGAEPGAPLNLSNLTLGTVRVEVSAPGRSRVERSVALQAGAWVQVPLNLPAAGPAAGDTWTEPKTGMAFVWVLGGSFQIGCGGAWAGECYPDEKPARQVALTGYWMAKTEVTQAQWQKVMGSNPSYFKGCADCPVEQVSWNDAQAFIAKLDPGGGQGLRLPTEAQWEYACRSGGKEETYCGGSDPERLAWYDKNSGGKTHAVGGKAANGLGLYDMSGNVYEWTCSVATDTYDGAEQRCVSKNDASGRRVVRGGSWPDIPRLLRSALRNRNGSGDRYNILGFRVARMLTP